MHESVHVINICVSRLTAKEYEQMIPMASVVRAFGSVVGNIECGMAFHSMHDMKARKSAAKASCS